MYCQIETRIVIVCQFAKMKRFKIYNMMLVSLHVSLFLIKLKVIEYLPELFLNLIQHANLTNSITDNKNSSSIHILITTFLTRKIFPITNLYWLAKYRFGWERSQKIHTAQSIIFHYTHTKLNISFKIVPVNDVKYSVLLVF